MISTFIGLSIGETGLDNGVITGVGMGRTGVAVSKYVPSGSLSADDVDMEVSEPLLSLSLSLSLSDSSLDRCRSLVS